MTVFGIVTILLCSSFVRVLFSLSIFRRGLGLGDAGSGLVIILLSLAISLSTVNPISKIVDGVSSFKELPPEREKELLAIITPRIDPKISKNTVAPSPPSANASDESKPIETVMGMFVLSEIRAAYQAGVMLLIPFVVIDIVVGILMTSLGITVLSAEAVCVPLKLLLFLLVDGWTLIIGRILNGI